MKSSKDLILAVDIGGTKFETALVGFDGNISKITGFHIVMLKIRGLDNLNLTNCFQNEI